MDNTNVAPQPGIPGAGPTPPSSLGPYLQSLGLQGDGAPAQNAPNSGGTEDRRDDQTQVGFDEPYEGDEVEYEDAEFEGEDGGEPEVDWREYASNLERQVQERDGRIAQFMQGLDRVAVQATVTRFETTQRQEWDNTVAWLQTQENISPVEAAQVLGRLREQQNQARTAFDTQLRTEVQQRERQQQQQILVHGWMDELQRKYDLTKEERNALYGIDPNRMEFFAQVMQERKGAARQQKRGTQADQRRQRGVDRAAPERGGNRAPKQYEPGSTAHLMDLAGDLFR